VLADGLGFAAALGAFGSALVVAAVVALASGRRDDSRDRVTAIVLAAALATGVILASDVFGSQARIDRLLFGSLLAIDGSDLLLAAIAAGLAVIATLSLGPRWLAAGFGGGEQRVGPRWADAALAMLVAFTAVASLAAVGALLATALIVIPAATTRLLTGRLVTWQLATIALAAAEGVGGLWLSFELNAPPGPAIAVLGGAVFACSAIVRAVRSRPRAAHGTPVGSPLVPPALLLVAVVAVAGCGSDGASGGRVEVVATTPQLADIASEVAGSAAHVSSLLRPGSDPHSYEPRPADVEAATRADVVLASGLGLDHWAREIVDSAGGDAKVIDVGARVPIRRRTDDREADPHWWHDPRNVIAAAAAIERELARAGAPAGALARSGHAYRSRLETLDRRIRRCFERIPPAERKLVTDHDALAYFAGRYGLRVVGAVFPAQSTQAQASAGEVAALERLIRAEHVRAVFPDAGLNARIAERVARDTGASVGGRLYGDSLGPPQSDAGTVAGMLATNARAIALGISGGRDRCPTAS
jgi:zinc/manganese transport system substrate-binding protein